MITHNVVLVLGAGASAPFGFPLGEKLKDFVFKSESNLLQMLDLLEIDRKLYYEFSKNLKRSQYPSIDAFLEVRPKYLDVGKAAMAYRLIASERSDTLFNVGDWYRYLFDNMRTLSFDEFLENNLSVITFNYDRSFEYFLTEALIASHDLDSEDAAKVLEAIPVVHVHGKLGELFGEGANVRPYKNEINPDTLRIAMNGIKIVSEGASEDPEFQLARNLIRDCQILIFIGFGYHRANVERLQLSLFPHKPIIVGTVKGFTLMEYKENIRPLFHIWNSKNNNFDALKFLRENVDLLISPATMDNLKSVRDR